MFTAFFFSFVAWLLIIFAACAVSTDPAILKTAAWARGTVRLNSTGAEMSLFAGLNGRVDVVDCTSAPLPELCRTLIGGTNFEETSSGTYQRFVAWDDPYSCSPRQESKVVQELPSMSELWDSLSDMCDTCRTSADGSVSFALVGAFTQLFQMATDLQRMTVFGDVNCQATMGAATSFLGLSSSLASLSRFRRSCWKNFPTEVESHTLEWKPGPAFVCLVIGIFLKLWDVLSHLVVPTPPARRIKPPKEVKNVAEYMLLATSSVEIKAEDPQQADAN